jgi:outer membrane protein
MKKVFVNLLFIGLFLMCGNTFAQNNLKIGHINSQLLFSAMPENDSASRQYEREATAAQKTLEEIQVEFNKKYEDYLKMTKDATSTPLILTAKEEELSSLQQRLQSFQSTAEESLNNRRVELFKPVQEKALKAVNDVAAENGFTYVFDTQGGIIVYTAPDSQDILPLVKTKLGLK